MRLRLIGATFLITIKILVGMSVVFVIFEACVVASGVWFFPYYATLPQLAMMISYMHSFRLTYQGGIWISRQLSSSFRTSQ